MKGVKTQLYSRLGLYLSVDGTNGQVKGTQEEGDCTIFFLIPVGLRIVAIQHRDTHLYIAMNVEGRIYTTVNVLTVC